MKDSIAASAPGKVILTGEHFVVHGAHSIAAAINRRVKVTIRNGPAASQIISGELRSRLDSDDGKFVPVKAVLRNILREESERNLEIEISSEIPAGSGLGSSAATSVAAAAATLKFIGGGIDPKNIFESAMLGERIIHGNPSGIDVETSLQGGLLIFSKSSGSKRIPLGMALKLLVAYSGRARNTSELISKVAIKKRAFPHIFESFTKASSFLTLGVMDAITNGDLPRLGMFLDLSQCALSWLGVSNSTMDEMLEFAMEQEVLGAKLTGAGGGGSIIILPKPESAEAVLKTISRRYPSSFLTSIPQEGLSWEN